MAHSTLHLPVKSETLQITRLPCRQGSGCQLGSVYFKEFVSAGKDKSESMTILSGDNTLGHFCHNYF